MTTYAPPVRRAAPASRPAVAVPTFPEALSPSPALPRHDFSRIRLTADRPAPARPVIQAKLLVGAAHDPAEREADRTAAHVMRVLGTPAPEVEAPAAEQTASVQRVGEGGAFEAGPEVETGIASARGGGAPLPGSVAGPMGRAFGADFGGVRVHADGRADALSRSIQARAFTTGSDIFFGRGAYDPAGPGGQELIAHELAHVVQQGGTARRATIQRLAYDDDPGTWGAVTLTRSAYGAKGVVEVRGGTDMILVKPTDDPGDVEFANQFVGAMGLTKPQMKAYALNTVPGGMITGLLDNGPIVNERKPNEIKEQIQNAHYYMVMDVVAGQSVPVLNTNDASEFIQNGAALQQIGRLMVVDAFLGNTDRLMGKVNWGNFLYQGAGTLNAKVATIDNDLDFHDVSTNGSNLIWVDALIDTPGALANMFLQSFKAKFKNDGGVLGVTVDVFVTQNITQGITAGLTDMVNLFRTNRDLLRSLEGANTRYGASAKRNVSKAKGVSEYVASRNAGESRNEAVTKLSKYMDYRAKRDFLPTGLKWLSRPLNLGRGF